MMIFTREKRAGIISIIVSSLCWYVSNGLNGDYWYVLWVAPLPLLLISVNTSAKQLFFYSFIAYFIGRMSWFSYLMDVATLVPAIIFTIVLSLFFACIMALTRKMLIKSNSWLVVFSFPVFFTAFEWFLITFSPDGTAASIAYSQAEVLPLIQMASVTGILGITFMSTFIPSLMALIWHFRNEKRKLIPLSVTSILLLVSVFLFGFLRIKNKPPTSNKVTVGLVVLDESSHKMGNLNWQVELEHTQKYALEIGKLADQGAKLVVLPERAININKEIDSASIKILSTCAKQHQVAIIAGFTNFKNEVSHNSALAINEQGSVIMDYNKIHLISGLEDDFVPGTEPGLFELGNILSGTAICKDLDFPEYIRQFGRSEISILCVPAWDFVVDDWLHSRMAILRGIENGFSMVRTARLGRLTISDPYGKVVSEESCSDGKATALIGQIPLTRVDTFYTQYGNWFGLMIIICALGFLVFILFK